MYHSNIDSLTIDIKTNAKTLGFMSCGIKRNIEFIKRK